MKILQINCVYDYGSTGKLTRCIHEGLVERGIESVVLYGRRDKKNISNVYKTCTELEAKTWNFISRVNGHPYEVAPVGTSKLIRYLKKEKPDVVHLQCINGFFVNIYHLVAYLKQHQIPTVLTLHAEFMFTGGCSHALDCEQWSEDKGCNSKSCPGYGSELRSLCSNQSSYMWKKMKQAFYGFEKLQVVSVSPWLMKRAGRSSILGDKSQCVVYNGVNTEIFYYRCEEAKRLRGYHQWENKKVVFHVTPAFSSNSDHLKGGYYVLELAKQMPDTVFLVAGECKEEIAFPENLKMLGKIVDQEMLAAYYSMADVTVLTSKRETFSMVCAESLCCGTPVVGFLAGGPETIAISEYSQFCNYGNIEQLEKLLSDKRTYEKNIIAEEAQKKYAISEMIEKYIGIYHQMSD